MNLLFTTLQVGELTYSGDGGVSYFELLLKGGWILVPIFLLSILSVYIIVERWVVISTAKNKDNSWTLLVSDMVRNGKIEGAQGLCAGMRSSSARVIQSGLEEIENNVEEIESNMELASRQEINRLENQMNYLGITAAIAPMLGFLGTIFGVIKIFYNISVTNDLNIASISDGLYQKMICSGAGLLVGIIAYAGYYILNGVIDRVINQVDKDSNVVLKSIKLYKKKAN